MDQRLSLGLSTSFQPSILGIPMTAATTATRVTGGRSGASAPRRDASANGGSKRAGAAQGSKSSHWFSEMAHKCAHWTGRPVTFLLCVGLVVVWALCGPLFDYSDTWQLVINTSTTIITFLMVFLIQNTQNRDTMAIQIKLAELICKVDGAENDLATAEDMSEEDLEKLHERYRGLADQALGHLKRRKGD
jgi:low affinity Fe/Cu permease